MTQSNGHLPSAGPLRVLILGAGFGGLYTSLKLEKYARSANVQVTLVSRDNYFLMTPLLFEASSGVLEPRHAVSPIRALLHSTRFVEGEIEFIDVEKRSVQIRHAPDFPSHDLQYDHLIVALGGVTNTRIIPGSELASTFKTLADGIFLRNHIIDVFERADTGEEPDQIQKLQTFIIIGGGLVGVELMGELQTFVRDLTGAYPHLKRDANRFYLIEATPRILGELSPELGAYATGTLKKRGVEVMTNTPVARIEADSITLKDGRRIESATIILAAGVMPNPLLEQIGVEKDKKGKIKVDGAMRSSSHPNVWAIGDCASIPDPNGNPYPPLAQHALREAKQLAKNIVAVAQGAQPQPFVYNTLGTLASLGHFDGVGRIMKLKVKGFLAWWIWRTYYMMQMPRWERRFRLILDWTVALLFKHDIVKLDFYTERVPMHHEQRLESAQARSAEHQT